MEAASVSESECMPVTSRATRLERTLARRLRREAIVDLTACGWRAAEIGEVLGISERSVERALARRRAIDRRKRRMARARIEPQ